MGWSDMFRVVFTFVVALMLSAPVWAGNWNQHLYKDTDWSHQFQVSCGLPGDTVQWLMEGDTKFLRFSLKNGQMGRCIQDPINRHGAPFWERVELQSLPFYLKKNTTYEIKLRLRFVQGFNNDRESFFQIHNRCPKGKPIREDPNGKCFPPLMFKVTADPRTKRWLHIAYLSKDKGFNHEEAIPWDDNANSFDPGRVLGEWVDIHMIVSRIEQTGSLKMSLKARQRFWKQAITDFDIMPNSKPYLKFGIYRPAQANWDEAKLSGYQLDYPPNPARYLPNETSVIDYDFIKIKKIK
jgi:hypothetical protein